jgi:hypothetical protein
MFYHQDWTNTTDIPFRAVSTIGYFGSLDPTDGGHAMRASLSANYHAASGDGQLQASAFYIYNQLNLFNDFTHFLIDPVHGDQEDQFESRRPPIGPQRSARYSDCATTISTVRMLTTWRLCMRRPATPTAAHGINRYFSPKAA